MPITFHQLWNSYSEIQNLLQCSTSTSFFQDTALKEIVKQGADKTKVIVGVPLYGQSFTLDDAKNNEEGAKSIWPGDAGEYTQQPGMLGYYEICSRSM